uniref:Uncharacterized protein n=1 Tax=Oryza barthii TaxID=65489 RepID=A0A0D3GK63_9ORYZ
MAAPRPPTSLRMTSPSSSQTSARKSPTCVKASSAAAPWKMAVTTAGAGAAEYTHPTPGSSRSFPPPEAEAAVE